ncbi:MAG TPA: ATP synthase F1 subunit delta [Candidatus Acidoferrales bacterium]|nr:ATP synthase F1 subunit delta [Candidatus Acidoferrales bacterium]
MIAGSLSRRYAKAVFNLALETRAEEAVLEELRRFSQALGGTPLGAVLSNPAYALTKRQAILDQVGKSLALSPVVRRLLSILLERRRLEHVPAIVAQYTKFLNDAKGRVEARVVSAAALEPAAREKLRARLREVSGKEIILQSETDPELIGGLVIELEGKTYDGSVRAHLEALEEKIERGYR